MNIGIAFDLKTDFESTGKPDEPEDLFEEYDSATTVEAIEAALGSRGHQVVRLGGGRRFLTGILETPPDIVFNIAEGRGSRSREAHVPAVCEIVGVPCTHSDPLTMAMTLDKAVAKRIVASLGVPTPRFAVVASESEIEGVDLRFPLFAKPLFEGSSMGIDRHSRLDDRVALDQRVEDLLQAYREPVLIEEYCSGAEFTVGILGRNGGPRTALTMEIVPRFVSREAFVYSHEVKRNWAHEIDYQTPPKRPRVEVEQVEALALAAYTALGCRDVARVDVRYDAMGQPQFIECNPLPGLAPAGWSDLALMWERNGRKYDDLILAILDHATARLGLS